MKSRQNRWNGGVVGREDYLEMNNIISASQNYTRNVGCYSEEIAGITYTRPTEWVSLPSITAGEQKFAGVFAVYNNDSNFVAFTCRGAYSVDWGDGTSNTYADNTTAQKVYNTTTYAGLTSAIYENYKTLIITITPQAGATLTSINLPVKHNQSNLSTYNNQWLDIKVAGSSISSLTIGTGNDPGVWPTMLEQFEFVGTNVITNFSGMFYNARSLQNIISLDTSSGTNFSQMHRGCLSLNYVPFYNTSNAVNTSSMFYQCLRLKRVPFFNTSKVTNMDTMFSQCYMITEIPAFNTSLVTTMSAMFENCNMLETIPWFDTRRVTDMYRFVGFCGRLKKFPYLNTENVTSMREMFANCPSLSEIPPINTAKVTNFFGFLGNAFGLKKVGPIDVSSATSLAFMFYFGSNLKEISFTKPTTNITNFTYTFYGCGSLVKINNLNTSNATTMGQMFANVNMPEIRQLNYGATLTDASTIFAYGSASFLGNTFIDIPNATSLNQTFLFNGNLKEIPPINAPKCLNMAEAFRGCGSLTIIKGLTLPRGASMASFNSAGFNSTFRDCVSLNEIPPIDFSGLSAAGFATVFTDIFTGCRSLGGLSGCTGFFHNFSISGCRFGATALNNLYQSLATVGASGSATKTITVTSNWGASAALGHNPAIAIAKGWAVTN